MQDDHRYHDQLPRDHVCVVPPGEAVAEAVGEAVGEAVSQAVGEVVGEAVWFVHPAFPARGARVRCARPSHAGWPGGGDIGFGYDERLDRVQAIISAFYSGLRGGKYIADGLFALLAENGILEKVSRKTTRTRPRLVPPRGIFWFPPTPPLPPNHTQTHHH